MCPTGESVVRDGGYTGKEEETHAMKGTLGNTSTYICRTRHQGIINKVKVKHLQLATFMKEPCKEGQADGQGVKWKGPHNLYPGEGGDFQKPEVQPLPGISVDTKGLLSLPFKSPSGFPEEGIG